MSATTPQPTPAGGEFGVLMSPLRIGSHILRNRVVTTAHGSFDAWGSPAAFDQFLAYQRARAAGGASMLILPLLMVEADPAWPLHLQDRLAKIADTIHAEGAVCIYQLVNMGGQMWSRYNPGGRPLWSFSGMQSPGGEVSHRMSDAEIAGVVAGYARAAKTATDAGIDGVELHGAHGYLIQQSFSPWGNSRDDRWGEPMRFTREVISATREAIGPDKLVGFRMAELDDHPRSEGGLSVEQLRSIAQDVIATNAVDYLNTSIGAYAPDYAAVAVGSYRTKPGHELQLTHDMRAAIGEAVPVVGVGRILDPWQAETALRSGDCDLVAMTRAHIADPDLVAKTTRGEAHRIRRCVGANECVDRKMAGLPAITCFHNPDVGREALGPVMLAERRQRVFVVGAGPGGLAAALTAARRGHDVTLVDRADGIGGQLAILRTTAASELLGAVDYLAAELAIFGVTPQLNVHVTAHMAASIPADVVVLATGATRTTTGAFPGSDHPHVVTSPTALNGGLGQDILVLDRLGDNEAVLVAEALSGRGHNVTFATRYDSLAPFAGYTHRWDAARLFRRNKIPVLTDVDISSFDGGVASLRDPEGQIAQDIPVDTIVAVVAPSANDQLQNAFSGSGVAVHVIGDAVAPRGAATAIREADALLRSI